MAERRQKPAAPPSRWDLRDMVWLADPGALTRRWRATSLASGWTRPHDWWAPEVDAVAWAALADLRQGDAARGSAAAVARLGRARGHAGVGLPEAIDDLYALHHLLPGGQPPPDVLRALAEAWVEVALMSYRASTCEDPLSGLASAAYLRTRLAEVYREAQRAGRAPSEAHALLVVRGVPASESDSTRAQWDRMLHRLTLGETLRTVFAGGETFAALSQAVTVGLVTRDDGLPRMLRGLMCQLRRVIAGGSPRVWIEGLPPGLAAAYELLADLER